MITITGVAATTRILNELPKRQQKKILPKAARAGGGVFLKAVKANAPATNKNLKRSLIQVVRRYRTAAVSIIGQDKNKAGGKKAKRRGGISGRGDVVPLHLVERPTKPHVVVGKPLLAFDGDGGDVVVRTIRHPGTQGAGFVRRAAKQAESAAVRAFVDKLRTETLTEAVKLGT